MQFIHFPNNNLIINWKFNSSEKDSEVTTFEINKTLIVESAIN